MKRLQRRLYLSLIMNFKVFEQSNNLLIADVDLPLIIVAIPLNFSLHEEVLGCREAGGFPGNHGQNQHQRQNVLKEGHAWDNWWIWSGLISV